MQLSRFIQRTIQTVFYAWVGFIALTATWASVWFVAYVFGPLTESNKQYATP